MLKEHPHGSIQGGEGRGGVGTNESWSWALALALAAPLQRVGLVTVVAFRGLVNGTPMLRHLVGDCCRWADISFQKSAFLVVPKIGFYLSSYLTILLTVSILMDFASLSIKSVT
ncbi:hypothetical protein V6N13_106589 [Hibiscus sabdariffa]|uniref:Uncharacterized protein n=1 Tax=Hibiscus sabdariffa TaxID=183260 RepID=A0ABR2F163_9ROSI